MRFTNKILTAVTAAVIGCSAANAEVININGYTGSDVINKNSTAINSWSLSRTVNDSSVFLSASFTLDASTSIDANDFFAVWLGNSNSPSFGIRGQSTDNPLSDVFARPQYAVNTELATNQVGSVTLNGGDSFSMLVNFYKTGGTSSSVYDGVRVWFNPTTADTDSSWDYAFTRTASNNISSFSSIGLRGANVDSNDSVTVSGLAIGTTFADVSPVPEASSLAMLLAGLGMMGFIARRRIG